MSINHLGIQKMQHLLLQLVVAAFFVAQSEAAQDSRSLAILLRHLDLIERLIEGQSQIPNEKTSSQHFDYARLQEDVQQIRQGIRDYMSPQRAQPRDSMPLSGEYRQKAEASP